ncbi:glycoside hydrolase family 3 C-terminal domain-containing protein [Kineococcus siccus]|uniref:glycoside hydrolase family 3 C-terminal domain-containing protein n=1 Tax=Kineococcus siccus TaxID=2696567 RepID=UPI00196B148D|nr:glycoside hydrolase family 3 C-terminal domain-containing protein [Kineococcus siccus]
MTPCFRDPGRSLTDRVDDLLGRLTPAERLSLLHQHVPAFEHLGIAPFRTGTEALHGVAWLGRATCFPQPVGLAAAWDADLLRRVGTATGREVRAKHAEDPSVSLNVWAPVVNPLRHPLWGRNEEGFSEDPHVTAACATAYATGLRGDHERVWLTVPTLKHFLGYSNETDRDTTSSQLRERVLHEYELPAFRGPVQAGVVGAVMLSYNLVNGVPAHVSPLVRSELRSWVAHSDDLAVVSDAGAPGNLVRSERTFPDQVAADAAAVRAGLDSFTDDERNSAVTLDALTGALEAGLLTGAEVDAAARRVLALRLRTGEFDGDADPYAAGHPDAPGPGELGRPEHVALAREAAGAGVVVLQNRRGLLPLPRTGRVAVVGALADRVLTDWYSGTPTATTSVAQALREVLGAAEVVVADGSDRVALRALSTGRYVRTAPDAVLLATGLTAGPEASFDVTDHGGGTVSLRTASDGLFVTRAGEGLRADATRIGGWSVQESFRLVDRGDGTTSLRQLATGHWVHVDATTAALVLVAEADEAERFVVRTLRAGTAAAVAAAAAADRVVAVVGNDPHLHGRETRDRRTLDLPPGDADLVRAVREVQPECVLAVVSSYPYALGDLVDDVDAVVWSCHAGQEVGSGVVDVLLGDVEPRGRLAQTWYRGDADLPDVLDYDVQTGRATYLWSRADPLFPFGHGLTYSPVTYTSATSERGGTGAAEHVTVRVGLDNPGERAAEELVQVYATAPGLRPEFPRRRLVGHARVRVEPGSSARAEITVPLDALAVRDVATGRDVVVPGTYHLLVGASAEDVRHELPLGVEGTPRAPRELGAATAFDAATGVLLVPRDGTEGAAVRTAHPGAPGRLEFAACATRGAHRLRCSATAPRGPAEVAVAVRGSSGAWIDVGRAAVDASGTTHVALPALGDGRDLRVSLHGDVVLTEVSLG